MLARIFLLVLLSSPTVISKDDDSTVPAVRVVRIQVEYPNATVKDIPKIHKDPIKNVKVDATSTVIAVSQIGLKGGIFQYTNALKVLGKPSNELVFDEAFFCYKGAVLVDGDECRKEIRVLRDDPIREREPIEIDRLIAL
ncbi:hypothetical protein ANCCAN_04111 [Ancylostoma caninum]|uniref:Uncharacterized protein n=1 Tax=Ancylostoma caninum TaxID=29170 RepID=A0A368H3L6_ANCCA|nr:hypothetical protein ANCCAN_04111 [Ancylostoma caninum]